MKINKKTKKKILSCKKSCRSELDHKDWCKRSFHLQDFWPIPNSGQSIQTIDYHSTSTQEFRIRFEDRNVPVLITNAMHEWPALTLWTQSHLSVKYKNEKFKVGQNDTHQAVFLSMKDFNLYLNSEQVMTDDSPLYIFDSSFATRLTNNTACSNPNKHSSASKPTSQLLNDYTVPKYFQDDYFKYCGVKKRPPYRWMVIGSSRSGSSIHVDPLGTSAWNALIQGNKRWILFPPCVDKNLIDPRGSGDSEAVTWFHRVYPRFLNGLGKQLGMIEVVQKRGEIMFVPSGWWHVVMNLDDTIAVTQNFCSRANIEYVWLKTRFSRPVLAKRLYKALSKESMKMSDTAWIFKNIVGQINNLKTIPTLLTSDSGSSSSSDSDSD